MSDTMQEMPPLTLDLGAAPAAPSVSPANTAAKEEETIVPVEQMKLTEQEQQMVDSFVPKIDLRDSHLVLQYGSGAQKKIADFSENVLGSVRTKDLGEIGEMLSGVVTELKSFDVEEEKGLFGFFKRSSNKITAMM